MDGVRAALGIDLREPERHARTGAIPSFGGMGVGGIQRSDTPDAVMDAARDISGIREIDIPMGGDVDAIGIKW